MNPKNLYVSQAYESLKGAITWMTAGKVLVHCCPDSLYYFHQNLLTPAEFLNSIEIQTISFNLTLKEDTVYQQPSRLNLKFVDLEEFDNYTKKYFRASLMAIARDEAPSEELLERLESVS